MKHVLYILTSVWVMRTPNAGRKSHFHSKQTNKAYLKLDIGKILDKSPWMSKIPLQGNRMAAIQDI